MKWSELAYRLRTYDISPPGGYCVEQGAFNRCEPDITALARMLLEYRKGNGKGRATLAECIQDCDRFQCLRLGNNPQYCIAADAQIQMQVSINQTSPYIAPPCRGCGATVTH